MGFFSFKSRSPDNFQSIAGLPTSLQIRRSEAGAIVAGTCKEFLLELRTSDGKAAAFDEPRDIGFSIEQNGQQTSQSFYTRSDCSPLFRVPRNGGLSTLTFGAGVSSMRVYLRHVRSGTAKFRVHLYDVTAGDFVVDLQPGAPEAFVISGPTTIAAGECREYTVTRVDRFNNPIPGAGNVALDSSPTGQFFAELDTSCAQAAIGNVQIPPGTSSARFRFLSESAGEHDLSAGTASDTPIFMVKVNAGGAASLTLSGPTVLGDNQCGRYQVTLRDALLANPTARSNATTVTLSGGSFFSDPACQNATGTVTIPGASESANVYFRMSGADARLTAQGDGFNSNPVDVAKNDSGALDGTFGRRTAAFGTGQAVARASMLASGKILVAGYVVNGPDMDMAVARFDATTGAPDTSFGSGGIVTIDLGSNFDMANAVAVDGSGRVLLAGTTGNGQKDFALVRLTANGSLDPISAGGAGGIVTTDFSGKDDIAQAIAVLPSGQILVVGSARHQVTSGGETRDVDSMALVRYDSEGVELRSGLLDFDNERGGAPGDDGAMDVFVASETRYYVAGYSASGLDRDMAVAIVNDTFVPSMQKRIDFNRAHHDVARAIAVDTKGDSNASNDVIYLGGSTRVGNQSRFGLAQITTSGTVASRTTTGFGDGLQAGIYDLVRAANGTLLAVGFAGEPGFGNGFAAARYTSAGAIDTSFGTNGLLTVHFGSTTEEARGVVLSGTSAYVAGTAGSGPTRFGLVKISSP